MYWGDARDKSCYCSGSLGRKGQNVTPVEGPVCLCGDPPEHLLLFQTYKALESPRMDFPAPVTSHYISCSPQWHWLHSQWHRIHSHRIHFHRNIALHGEGFWGANPMGWRHFEATNLHVDKSWLWEQTPVKSVCAESIPSAGTARPLPVIPGLHFTCL